MGGEMITFGGWLKQRRKELGVTQDELADHIGCSLATLQKIEGGVRRPSGQLAHLLADYFRVPSDEREAFTVFARAGQVASSDPQPALVALAHAPWRAVSLRHTNLPVVLTALIGREHEEEAVRDYLLNPKVRLLSMTGPPGVGKTRLALQVASSLAEHFEDGVFFIDLAPVLEPGLVLPTIGRVLGLKEAGELSAERVLVEYVRERRMLLVLDNFEQVLDAASEVVKLMQASPWLKVLVTSREALHVRGERRLSVPPLGVPGPLLFSGAVGTDDRRRPLLEALATYPSVKLFVERAQDVNPDFELTRENARDVAMVCAELEGLPLAIELAAARANHLSSREMRTALDNRLKLLKGEARDLPARHRTLRAAVEWSYDLLDTAEQTLFRGLGAFAGGSALAAIEAIREVAEADDQQSPVPTLDVLVALVDKSLVRQQGLGSHVGEGGESRFGMLEVIREYALEKLIASGEADAVRQRHARYFVALAREASANKSGPREASFIARLDAELDNLRSALDWLLDYGREDPELTELALHMVIALFYFWDLRGYFTEGREWLARALENGDRNLWCADCLKSETVEGREAALKALRAKTLNTAGLLAWHQADYQAAQALYEAGLTLRREVGDKAGIASSLNNLAILANEHGGHEAAIKLHEEALALQQELGDKMNIALSLNNLGVAYWDMGDVARARPFYEKSLVLYRELGYKSGMVLSLDNLGMVATNEQDYTAARHYQEECLAICRELGDKNNLAHVLANAAATAVEEGDYTLARNLYAEDLPLLQELGYRSVIAKCFAGMAAMSHKQERPIEAARLWGVAEGLRLAIDNPMGKMGREQYERQVDSARSQAGTAVFEAAWTEGRVMPIDQAIEYALGIQGATPMIDNPTPMG
jgi:predicted ATPase/DNA-binding XRE family transcriptional regulator